MASVLWAFLPNHFAGFSKLATRTKTKKLLKTMPDPWNKCCKSHVVFPRRIFRILVSIWGGFGVQKRCQNHPPGTKTLGSKPFWGVWNTTTVQNDVLEGPKSIFEHIGVDLGWFKLDFFKIWLRFWVCFLLITFSHEFPISTSSQIIVFRISIFLTSSACPNKAWKLNNQALVIFLVATCIEVWNSVKRHHLL